MGMNDEMYLSPEDFETAAKNGINYHNAYERFYKRGWSKERTITEPIRTKAYSTYAKYKDVCVVSRRAFENRLKRGMSPEEAATIPRQDYTVRSGKGVLSKALYEQALENGIGRATVHARVYIYNWSVERAITTPVNTKFRKKKSGQ
jgi:hypothetical protein